MSEHHIIEITCHDLGDRGEGGEDYAVSRIGPFRELKAAQVFAQRAAKVIGNPAEGFTEPHIRIIKIHGAKHWRTVAESVKASLITEAIENGYEPNEEP